MVLDKAYPPGTGTTGGKRYVSYQVKTSEGRRFEGRYEVLPGTWHELKQGDPVTVEYLENSPDTNRIPGQRAKSLTWALLALVLLMSSLVGPTPAPAHR